MSAARRGAIAATVLLAGLVALLLSPATTRAVVQPTASSVPEATSTPKPSPTPTACVPTVLRPCLPTPGPTPFPISTTTTTSTLSTTSTLTYAVLPGSATIPPTATPKSPPTPTPSPAAVTDTGTSALGTDTSSLSTQDTRATTVNNPLPGGDSSSVLPLTVLAFLVLIGGGAVFVVTRLR